MTIRYALTILAAPVLIAAGCGGSDDDASPNETAGEATTQNEAGEATPNESAAESETTTGEPLSMAEFIEQADAICEQFIEDTPGLRRRYKNLGAVTRENAGEAAEVFDRIAEQRAQTTQELRQLEPPSDDSEVVDDYLSTREIVDSLIAGLASAYRELDADRSEALSGELQSGRQRAREIARGYGFNACGQIDE